MRLEQSEVVFSCILYTLYIMDFAKQTLPSAFCPIWVWSCEHQLHVDKPSVVQCNEPVSETRAAVMED